MQYRSTKGPGSTATLDEFRHSAAVEITPLGEVVMVFTTDIAPVELQQNNRFVMFVPGYPYLQG